MTEFDDVIKEMREDRKKAEHCILFYEKEKKQYEAEKEQFLADQKNESVGRKSMPASPTEAIAVISAQYDAEHEAYPWLKAVELALKTFGERKHIFVDVRREAERHCTGGRKKWVLYTQRRYSEEIQKRFLNDIGWLGERTVRSWWYQIVNSIVEFHLRLEKKNK